MNSRAKYVIVVLVLWLALFSTSFLVTKSLLVSEFKQLEYNSATEASQRIARALTADLQYIDLLNADLAIWDETYNYVTTPRADYIRNTFAEDFFIENRINEIIIINQNGAVILAKGYDLKSNQYYTINPDVLDYFKNNFKSMLKYKQRYNHLSISKSGLSGLLQQSSQSYPNYYSVNYIKNTEDDEAPNGALIFGKMLTPEFMNSLNKKLGYKIRVVSPDVLETTPEKKQTLEKIARNGGSYIEPINNRLLAAYTVLNNLNFKPIGLLRADLSRDLPQRAQQTALYNQNMLFIISLVGLLPILTLIYLLFRKQEPITDSVERFFPNEFIELLDKKSITEAGFQDNTQHTIAVLFLDIRNFAGISQHLTSQGSPDFIKSILSQISPIIVAHQGFIDKYVGDSIIALFAGESCADDAINSSLCILKKLEELNKNDSWDLASQEVHVGIGINLGALMLGISDEKNRLEGTVIGDAVNMAARIESMTNTFEQNILISHNVYQSLKRPERYNLHDLGEVKMQGKQNAVRLYGVSEIDSGS